MSRTVKSGKSNGAGSYRGVPNLARLVSVVARAFQSLITDSARRRLLTREFEHDEENSNTYRAFWGGVCF